MPTDTPVAFKTAASTLWAAAAAMSRIGSVIQPRQSSRAGTFRTTFKTRTDMHLIRQSDGQRPTEYAVTATELPRAWRWDSRLGSGYSAIGRTAEEAEMLLRDALAHGRGRVSRAPELA